MKEVKYIRCTACGKDAGATQQDDAPDNGWEIYFDHFGYYGGFTDDIQRKREKDAVVCHDCCVKLLDLFPEEFQKKFMMSHPGSTDGEPCCKYAWRGTELFGKYTKDAEGRRYPVAGVHIETAWPDGAWSAADVQPTHYWLDGEAYEGDFIDGEWHNVSKVNRS